MPKQYPSKRRNKMQEWIPNDLSMPQRIKNKQHNAQQDQTNPQEMKNAWTADKPLTHIGVEHAQGPNTTHLYPANIGAVGHGLEVKEGMV